MVATRLLYYMGKHGLHELLQAAYKINHSVETAPVYACKLTIILSAMDSQKVEILVLLDLSSANDAIDHTVLPQRPFPVTSMFQALLR